MWQKTIKIINPVVRCSFENHCKIINRISNYKPTFACTMKNEEPIKSIDFILPTNDSSAIKVGNYATHLTLFVACVCGDAQFRATYK